MTVGRLGAVLLVIPSENKAKLTCKDPPFEVITDAYLDPAPHSTDVDYMLFGE